MKLIGGDMNEESPLMLLHGNLGRRADWDGCVSLWRKMGMVAQAIDLWHLAHGALQCLEAAGKEIAERASRNSVLVGYSLGGRLALHAVAEDPLKWRALVLISAHPGLTNDADRARRLESDCIWAEKCRMLDPIDFLKQWNAQPVLKSSRRDPQTDYDREAVARAFEAWSLGRQRDFRPLLKKLEIPLLWLVGEKDEKFKALAFSCRPDAVKIVSGAGHRLPMESAEETACLIAEFLRTLP